MSTIAYAQLTNKREEAQPGTSSTTSNPGIKSYIDAFAALVPAEVLTLHALVISATTNTVPAKTPAGDAIARVGVLPAATPGAASAVSAVGTTTTILPNAVHALTVTFWILLALSVILFVVPRYFGGKWDKFDWLRASIAPLAFVGWTMLQRATAFDAVFPNVSQVDRTVYALILGGVLGAVTAGLAAKADAKPAS